MLMGRLIRVLALSPALLMLVSLSHAQEQAPGHVFGSPDSVENTLAEDNVTWDDFRQNLIDQYGLTVSADYTAALLTANETFSDDTGAGGIARLYGTYDLFNVDNGTLVWKFEHRHAHGDTSPFDFSLGQIGYVGLQMAPFNDQDFRTQNLYWRQRLNDGRSTLYVGVLDATDYVDVFGLASPWMHFMNLAFSTGSATIGLPNDAAAGIAFGTMVTDNLYVVAGITDTNGDPTRPFEGFGNFFSDNEYFTSVEIGYTPAQDQIFFDNYHVTVWHKDKQEAANIPDGWGINFSVSRFLNNNLMPFFRGGYAEDAGSLLETSISVGLGYKTVAFDGLLGAAINWGSPNADTFGPGLDDQFALEMFYRVPAGKRVAITADVQYIKDPALNPDESSIWMLNLRGRIAF